MKEQVEQEPLGWSKEFCLPGKRPLALTKSGSVLCFDYMSLSIYDAISSTSKEIVDSLHSYRIFAHKNTPGLCGHCSGGYRVRLASQSSDYLPLPLPLPAVEG
uniref:Elongation factor G n=1 Tax=Papaver somniferum TaxID=3469 RepID=A0A5B7LJW5_PAPSO|nr:elongation factor G [Papaver somniferum]